MTTLTIRNLDARVNASLRDRATRNGRSAEEEAHRILAEILTNPPPSELNLAEAIRRRFARIGGIELEPHPSVAITDPTHLDR